MVWVNSENEKAENLQNETPFQLNEKQSAATSNVQNPSVPDSSQGITWGSIILALASLSTRLLTQWLMRRLHLSNNLQALEELFRQAIGKK